MVPYYVSAASLLWTIQKINWALMMRVLGVHTIFIPGQDLSRVVPTVWPAGKNFLVDMKALRKEKHIYIYNLATLWVRVQLCPCRLWVTQQFDRKCLLERTALQGDLVSSAGFVPKVWGMDCSSQTIHHNGDSTACSESKPSRLHSRPSQCLLHTCQHKTERYFRLVTDYIWVSKGGKMFEEIINKNSICGIGFKMLNLELLQKFWNATELVASAPVKHLNFNQTEWMSGWKNGSRGKTLTSSSDCPSPPAALPPRTWSHACEEASLSCWSHTHTPTYQSRKTHHGVRGKGYYNLKPRCS